MNWKALMALFARDCARGSAQLHRDHHPDHAATADVRLHLRTSYDPQWNDEREYQGHDSAWTHWHRHDDDLVQAVAMPLLAEFQFTKEIEDRLLAPIQIEWLAVEKLLAGTLQALFAGAVAGITARLLLGSGIGLSAEHLALFIVVAILSALFASSGGLTLGCSVGQNHIGLMFSLVLAPMIMFGCAYYPWSALASFPILQMLVLLNPFVYASEGLRGTLAPQYPHISTPVIIVVLAAIDIALITAGLNRFRSKAVG